MSNPFSLSFPLLLTAVILLIQAHAETALQSSEQHTKIAMDLVKSLLAVMCGRVITV